jgi:hypothetical protein
MICRRCKVKRLLKIMIILLLLEHAGIVYNETKWMVAALDDAGREQEVGPDKNSV